jgi:hypothetical protein
MLSARNAPVVTVPLRVRACFGWAIRQTLISPLTPRALLLVIAASLPLYLTGYASGAWPWLGWLYALFAGPAVLAVLIGWGSTGDGTRTERSLVALRTIAPHALFYTLAFGAFYGGALWLILEEAGPVMHRLAVQVFSNSLAWWWKPIAHLSAFGVLFFGAFTVTVLAVITRLRQRMPPRLALSWSRKVLQERVYARFRLLAMAHVLALVAFVPVVGLVVLPVAAWMTVRFYQYAFSSQFD